MAKRLILAAAVLACSDTVAQTPGIDIFLAPFSERGGVVTIAAPVNVTARPRYDNQPWFIDGGAFWFGAGDSSVSRIRCVSWTPERGARRWWRSTSGARSKAARTSRGPRRGRC